MIEGWRTVPSSRNVRNTYESFSMDSKYLIQVPSLTCWARYQQKLRQDVTAKIDLY